MRWIERWSDIDGDRAYIVMAKLPNGDLYQPQILTGWQVKRLMEGVYSATEFFPPNPSESVIGQMRRASGQIRYWTDEVVRLSKLLSTVTA